MKRALNATTGKSFLAYASAHESKLAMPGLTRAVEKLIGVGTLDVQRTAYPGRTANRYRMGSVVMLRTGVIAASYVDAETAPGIPEK